MQKELEDKKVASPENVIQQRLLDIWKELLGNKNISINNKFNTIGGNSITIIKLISRISKEFGIKLSLRQLFDNLTIKMQSELIGSADKEHLLLIPKAPLKDSYSCTLVQERIFYKSEFDKESTAYNLPIAWSVHGPYDEHNFQDVFEKLIDRHSSFRTTFHFHNDELKQHIADKVDFKI